MPTDRVAEKGMRTMWLARSKTLAWALVLLGGSTVGVLAFAQRPKEPAKPNLPVAQVVGPAPPAVKEGRVTDKSPEVSRVLPVGEGSVRSVAFGPEGRIAAGYYVISSPSGGVGGVVVFDARRERFRPAPLAVEEGLVTCVAFGPEGRIAAGYYDARRRGGLRRARGASPPGAAGDQGGPRLGCGLRPGGPDRRRLLRRPPAAGAAWWSSTCAGSGSARRRWRSRKAGSRAWASARRAGSPPVTHDARRRGGLRRARGASPPGAAGGQGRLRQLRGLRPGGPDRRRLLRRQPAVGAAWWSSTCAGSGSARRRWRSRRATSRAWPSARTAGSPPVTTATPAAWWSSTCGERLLRRPAVKGGQVRSVAFSPEGRIAAGYVVDRDGGEANPPRAVGGVVVFDAP